MLGTGRKIWGAIALALSVAALAPAAHAASLSSDFSKKPVARVKNLPVHRKVGVSLTDTRANLTAFNNQYFISCGNGCITGAQLNSFNAIMISSLGVLTDTNPWTGANSWAGVSNFTGAFEIGGNAMTFPGAPATLLYNGGPGGTPSSINLSNATNFAPPTLTTLGGIEAINAVAHKWINAISTLGAPSLTQPNFTDLVGSATCGQLPALTGDVTSTAGSCATTVGAIGGNAVSLAGGFATSGAFSIALTATASTNVTLPTSGTLATTAGVTSSITSALPNLTTSQIYGGSGGAGVAQAFPLGTNISPALQVALNAANGVAGLDASGYLKAAQFPVLTGDVTTGGGSLATTIAANAVTNAKAAQMAAMTFKGNNTAGPANGADLTVAQAKTMLGGLPISIVDYGGDPTGANDNATPCANAVAALTAGGSIQFPHGNYRFNSGCSLGAVSGVSLVGESVFSTILERNFTSGDLITIGSPFDEVRNMSSVPLVRGISGAEFHFVYPCSACKYVGGQIQYSYNPVNITDASETTLENLWITYTLGSKVILYSGTVGKGSFGAVLNHINTDNPYPLAYGTVRAWATSTAYTAGQIVAVNGALYQCSTSGTSASSGVGPTGLPSGTTPQSAFTTPIVDGTAQWKFVDLQSAALWNDSYGYSLRVNNFGAVDGAYGFVEADGANTGTSLPEFAILNDFEADHAYSSGLFFSAGYDTQTTHTWADGSLQAEGVAVGAAWTGQLSLVNAHITANWTNGVTVNGGVDFKLAASWVASNSQDGSTVSNGVVFAANVSKAILTGNTIGLDPAIGSNLQGYALVLSGMSDYIIAADNDLHGNASGGVSSSASGAHNKIVDNAGYNPVGTTAAANVGASPATITAGASPETHYIKQSANFNATVAKGGQTICGDTVAAVPCVVQLGPNESYVVTWTTTQPTYVKDVH